MARIPRGSGGRGGATRLKLYLSLLWLAPDRERPVFTYPAHQLAALLDLPNPDRAGARRIQDALRWLHEQSFVALDRQPGNVTRVHLLDDAGTGTPYRDPGSLTCKKAGLSDREREQHSYVQLPGEYWTNGWVTHLSGAATAMYLAALRGERGPVHEPVWISPPPGRPRAVRPQRRNPHQGPQGTGRRRTTRPRTPTRAPDRLRRRKPGTQHLPRRPQRTLQTQSQRHPHPVRRHRQPRSPRRTVRPMGRPRPVQLIVHVGTWGLLRLPAVSRRPV
jgi:hypothetical protein